MTQDKMRRIITACTAAVTTLLVFLLTFVIYQWITMASLNNKIKRVKAEIYTLEMQLENAESELEYYQTEVYLQKAYQELRELEGKK